MAKSKKKKYAPSKKVTPEQAKAEEKAKFNKRRRSGCTSILIIAGLIAAVTFIVMAFQS